MDDEKNKNGLSKQPAVDLNAFYGFTDDVDEFVAVCFQVYFFS